MVVVLDFDGRVDAADDAEGLDAAIGRGGAYGQSPTRRHTALDAFDVDQLVAGETEAGDRLARLELQRQHAHADEVAAVDALEALDDDRLDAEEAWALGGPVTR